MKTLQEHRTERGSIIIMAAVAMIALLGMAAVMIDIGYMLVTRSKLQNVADSAAASGTLELGRIYGELGSVDPKTYTLTSDDKTRIFNSLNSFARKNEAAGQPVSILPGDVVFASWNRSSGSLVPTDRGVTAVSVMARRDKSANGVVSTLMSSVLGVDQFSATADAANALSPAAKMPRGKIDFPVGIARAWFEHKDSPCGGDTSIAFYPTGTVEGCAGWHTFESWPANAAKLKDILHQIEHHDFVSPEVVVDKTELVFTGGTVDSALQMAKRAFDANKDWVTGEWLVHLPVYDRGDCSNPSGKIKVVGIATAVITEIDDHGGDKSVRARVECDFVGYGEGGGPDYGTYVSMPSVVN